MQQPIKWKTALIVTSLVLGTTALAHAGSRHHNGDGCHHQAKEQMRGGGIERAIKHVDNLSPEQQKQLEALIDQHRDATRELQEQRRIQRRALRDAFSQGADSATIESIAEAMGQLSKQRIMLRARVRADLAGVLTAEQQKQLGEWRKQASGEPGKRYHNKDRNNNE